jgi:hypothetical protein
VRESIPTPGFSNWPLTNVDAGGAPAEIGLTNQRPPSVVAMVSGFQKFMACSSPIGVPRRCGDRFVVGGSPFIVVDGATLTKHHRVEA